MRGSRLAELTPAPGAAATVRAAAAAAAEAQAQAQAQAQAEAAARAAVPATLAPEERGDRPALADRSPPGRAARPAPPTPARTSIPERVDAAVRWQDSAPTST